MDFESKFPAPGRKEHEPYARLCALFTSGELTEDEHAQLGAHLAGCESCAALLQKYRALAKSGMALLAPPHRSTSSEESLAIESAKAKLMKRIASDRASRRPRLVPRTAWSFSSLRMRPIFAGAAALLVMAAIAGFSYRLGQGKIANIKNSTATPPAEITSQPAKVAQVLTGQNLSSQDHPAAESSEVPRLKQELKRQEAMITESQALQEKLQRYSQKGTAAMTALDSEKAALASERDALNHRLQETQAALEAAQQRLQILQEEQKGQLLRTASLQTRVDELSASLTRTQDAARRDEGFLASGRDIRELMGARELYIADVFDIDREGKARKPFGRVFYTGGKSLLFYAFDLDREPGVREASTFQVWGRRGPGDKRPLSMGILYEDSAANRRWTLRFDDPKVLAEIDAVFVTVEPRGKTGQKPTGRQLLFASLRTPPNHP